MKFQLDEHELKKLEEWNKMHINKCHNGREPYSGAIGGRIEYIFSHTSIGTMVSAQCCMCKGKDDSSSIDLTDYSNW